jgi:uncharacterized protein
VNLTWPWGGTVLMRRHESVRAVAGVAAFFAVAVFIVAAIHGYLYMRLVRDTTAPGRLRRVGLAVTVLLAALLPVTLALARALEPAKARPLLWPGYLWLGLMFYLLVILLLIEVPRFLIAMAVRRRAMASGDAALRGTAATATMAAARPESPGAAPAAVRESPGAASVAEASRAEVSRRLVLARGGAAVAGVAATALVGYGMASALGPVRIVPVRVALRRLDAGLDGLRIAVVSDIHLGPTLGRRHTERIVRLINEQEPDLVAIVGDLVDGTVEALGDDAAPLADLASRHGSFFVTGNHDYYSGFGPWAAELERLGVQPLRNERVEIGVGSAVLDLAGVNDPTGEQEGDGPDFDRALGGRDQERPVVLLAHQPVQVHEAARRGVDLQLSGHTHGGQLYPFDYLIRLQQPVVSGMGRFGDTQLYVTNGAGFWGPPMRVGAPPEITMIELTA